MVEGATKAQYARVLELMGRWDEAADLAREVLDGATISQLVARPILAVLDVRKGRPSVEAELGATVADGIRRQRVPATGARRDRDRGARVDLPGARSCPSGNLPTSCGWASIAASAGPPGSSPAGCGVLAICPNPRPVSPSRTDC